MIPALSAVLGLHERHAAALCWFKTCFHRPEILPSWAGQAGILCPVRSKTAGPAVSVWKRDAGGCRHTMLVPRSPTSCDYTVQYCHVNGEEENLSITLKVQL